MPVTIIKKSVKKNKEGELVLKEAKGSVTIQADNDLENTKPYPELSAQVFDGPNCNVGYKMGYTKNLGNYESMRIDITINVPANYDQLEDAFEFAKEWADEKMNAVVKEIDEEIE